VGQPSAVVCAGVVFVCLCLGASIPMMMDEDLADENDISSKRLDDFVLGEEALNDLADGLDGGFFVCVFGSF